MNFVVRREVVRKGKSHQLRRRSTVYGICRLLCFIYVGSRSSHVRETALTPSTWRVCRIGQEWDYTPTTTKTVPVSKNSRTFGPVEGNGRPFDDARDETRREPERTRHRKRHSVVTVRTLLIRVHFSTSTDTLPLLL